MIGVFKYEPICILSSSMNSLFGRGDVVIYKKINKDEIKEVSINSVIIYSIDEQYIVHRVINIINENGTIYFRTKGDNNNTPDVRKVSINQVVGIYVFHIKYLRFPSVWLHDYFQKK